VALLEGGGAREAGQWGHGLGVERGHGTMGSGAAERSRGAGVTARKKELPSGPWLSARRGGRASALTRDWGEGG